MNGRIIVVTHKKYEMPEDRIYFPVCVGKGIHALRDKYQPDDIGDNISEKNNVECMWLMMQQEKPEDFVIATGVQHTVRDFTERAFAANGITLRWEGSGIDEKGYDTASGKMLVCVNPAWFRPTDVDNLLGDPTKAKTVLGWNPQKTSYEELVRIMAEHDRVLAKREKAMKEVKSL
jgi:GDPmannose 4,6-dehydratase